MTRVHDMGGRYGDGPVAFSDDATFARDWHARALALTLAAGALGQWNIDVSRHARERLSPRDYGSFSYYEKWLAALADLLVERGVLTRAELETGHSQGATALAQKVLRACNVEPMLSGGSPYLRQDGPAARFEMGDRVRTRRPARNVLIEGGHTRLPGYASGAVGEILRLHGAHVLPDSNAHDLGEAPEPLYAVCFAASDLWGDEADPSDEVILDLWQSYLEPA